MTINQAQVNALYKEINIEDNERITLSNPDDSHIVKVMFSDEETFFEIDPDGVVSS